jgi:hypothetical protein
VKAVDVTLDGVTQPSSRVAEFSRSSVVAKWALSSQVRICCQDFGRRARCDRLGSDDGVRVAVADDSVGRGGWRPGRG